MEKNSKIENKIVQTYAEDMAKVIEDDKSGLIKKIIHEEERHEIEKRNLSPESRKNKFFMLMSLILILLGLATLFYFFLTAKEVPTVAIEKQFAPIIFLDQNTFLEVKDFNQEKIIQTILNKINGTLVKNGGIEGIHLTENKRIVGLRRFISLIKANFIPVENTLLVSDNFLIGVVNTSTKDFFILLKMRSVPDIFDAMRAWERKLFSDLHQFFEFDVTPETKYLLTKEFQNGILENKNSRILYNNNNEIVMIYIFADDNSVIITDTENTAHEIMLRLSSSRVKK